MKVFGTMTLAFETLVKDIKGLKQLIKDLNNGTFDPSKLKITYEGRGNTYNLSVNNGSVEVEETDRED